MSIPCVQTLRFFTHIFLQHLDADIVWFGLWIIKQTRTAVVTHGLGRRQMVISLYLMDLRCFHRIRGQSKSFRVGLGAYPWRTETDATDLDKYRAPWPLETHLLLLLCWTLLWHKDDSENVSKHDLWSSPVIFSTANCGQKKRGSWAQKGKRSHWILLHSLFLWCLKLDVTNEC